MYDFILINLFRNKNGLGRFQEKMLNLLSGELFLSGIGCIIISPSNKLDMKTDSVIFQEGK